MNGSLGKLSRCAVYTRKSTDYNLDLAFTSLDAQREACEAYIKSQTCEGWRLISDHYDDGAFSGASLERPALQRLLGDVRGRRIDMVVVYKVDRLTRSLADFAKLIELFETHCVSFVSVTQSFNTSSSMGRLTLNVLLSFAQFERELIGERVRDKDCGLQAQGNLGRGPGPARLCGCGQEDRGRPCRGRGGSHDLCMLSGSWLDENAGRRPRSQRHPQQAAAARQWPTYRRRRLRGGGARLFAQEPVLYRRGGLPWRGPSWRSRADPGSAAVRSRAGQACGPNCGAALPVARLARPSDRAPV